MLWNFAGRTVRQGACPLLHAALCRACSKLNTVLNAPALKRLRPSHHSAT